MFSNSPIPIGCVIFNLKLVVLVLSQEQRELRRLHCRQIPLTLNVGISWSTHTQTYTHTHIQDDFITFIYLTLNVKISWSANYTHTHTHHLPLILAQGFQGSAHRLYENVVQKWLYVRESGTEVVVSVRACT